MTRVLVAGFQHETNTFASRPAEWADFVNGEGYPGLHLGADVLRLRDVNVPLGGFLAAADPSWQIVPVVWCAASPSAPVTTAAFDKVTGLLVDACRGARPDAVYLDLHGAMVTADHDDGDGEILRLVRSQLPPDVPVVVSLDLHANVSDAMLDLPDGLVAYRTYPHVDMADTGARSAAQLRHLLAGGRLHRAAQRLDFLIPVNSGSTLTDPGRKLYAALETPGRDDLWLSLAAGFPASDIPDCRPCVFGDGPDPAEVQARVADLARRVAEKEADFVVDALPATEAIARAAHLAAAGRRPVVVADTQDNPGAGGDATTTGLLRALLEADHPRSALATMWAPEVVARARAAGEGSMLTARFDGSGLPGDGPLEADVVVERLTDGRVTLEGPMLRGTRLDAGPTALLRHGHVAAVVTSHKAQVFDRNQFRAAGIVPEQQDILVVKSSVHFRGDFAPIAGEILVALAPGPMQADPGRFPWTRLAPGVRVRPLGPAFGGQ